MKLYNFPNKQQSEKQLGKYFLEQERELIVSDLSFHQKKTVEENQSQISHNCTNDKNSSAECSNNIEETNIESNVVESVQLVKRRRLLRFLRAN